MKTINYESDFKLVERRSDGISLSDSPFRFTYYVKINKWTYVAEYDGQNYVNCLPTGDGGIVVAIDSPQFVVGVLSVRREFYLDDSDFKDGVYNLVSVESAGVLLDKGITDDSAEIEVEVLPFFAKTMGNVEHDKKVINHESDFKIVEGFNGDISILDAPFKFTYYTNPRRGNVVASYDGKEFTNCYPTDDNRVVIPFDNHGLGIGSVMVKREFYLADKDYANGECHLVSIEPTGITLDSGATDFAGAVNIEHSPYYHRVGSDISEGGITTELIADGAVTMAKLSEEVNNKLNQGSGFSGDYNDLENKPTIPTNVSQLTNDKGYITDIADDSITEEKLSEEVRTKLNQGGGMTEIPDGGVTTAKIADGAVTDAKLSASLAATISKIDILYKVDVSLVGGGNKKKGTTASVTLSWTVKVNGSNVNPTSQTLNGEVLGNDVRSKTFTGVTTNTTYTLVVDGVTKTATVSFFNPSYFGVVAPDYQVSSDVSGLTEQSNYGSRALTKTVKASGSMKVVYLYPSALGALASIKDGNNFDVTGSFTKTTDITINGEKYIAYLLTQEANINGLTFKFT